MHLTLFAISGLFIALTYFPLLLFILLKGKTKIARIYALHILSIFIWGIGSFLIGINTNQNIANNLWKFAYSGVIFIPVFFQHAVLLMLDKKSISYLVIIYAQACYFIISIFNNQMMASTRLVFNSFYYHVGTFTYLLSFIAWVTIVSIAHIQITLHYKICYPHQKGQFSALILAITGFWGGIMNFLPGFGIDLYPYGNFFVPIHSIIVTYAILKYQLLDIVIAIRKSVIYSLLIALISLLYLLTVFVLERFAQGLFGYRSLIISIFTAFGLGLLFFPLRHRIQQFVDRYFFKGTQQEIVLQNEQLRQEIAQSEKYKTLSTLASGIAHEIKNPLTAMKTFCEYLPRKLDDREFLLKFSRLVGKEVERIDGMVHELLDYGKPAPLALKKTDINKLIQDTLNTLNSQFIKNRIDVVVTKSSFGFAQDPSEGIPSDVEGQGHTSPGNALLSIDANRVKQVLLNLFLNAIEAMPRGGKLTVSSFVDRTSHIVTIADTGSGIAPDDLKHIFDPFFSRKDHGTGLGLAIVQGIMEQHRGKVRITSQAGVGTEVRLEFPIHRENTLN